LNPTINKKRAGAPADHPLRAVLAGAWALLVLPLAAAAADYRDDIGYVSLAAELGSATPSGLGVPVSQVENPVPVGPSSVWMPDIGDVEFSGKSIIDKSGGVTGVYSSHATGVAKLFYGLASSTAIDVSSVSVYSALTWVGSDFLLTPTIGNGAQPLISASRVANHSWIGSTTNVANNTTYDSPVLRRLDWVIDRDEFITAVGVNNGGSNVPLLSSSFNAIAVGRSDGGHAAGTVSVGLPAAYDTTYTAGRVKPDLVAPDATTSGATALVSAAAALLVQVGHANAALSTDPVSQSTTNRAGNLIRNAERSEVIKAALMAGALRSTSGNVAAPDITDYRVAAGNQTSNGLDRRFGAGQLNIANSYHIIAAGEKNNIQDSSAGGGQAGLRGFDYDRRFGGAAGTNNDVATYYFPVQATDAQFTFALVWNLKIHGGSLSNFNSTAYFYNLDALLYDVTNAASPVLVASSTSTTENTENLNVVLTAGRAYSVQVKRAASQATFDWDFGAAWQITPQLSPDSDGDGVADSADNCTQVANTSQCDSDGDGYGNRCDGDMNNSGSTNAQDTTLYRQQLGQPSAGPGYNAADLNCSGAVNAQDTVILRTLLGSPPGPSGLAP
jgi:hypothetical protein